MAHVTIYHKPTCSTCRKVVKLVKESGQPFSVVNYYETPLTETKLKALLKKAGLTAKDVMRPKEEIYHTLDVANADKSEEELIGLIVKHPDLLQRPLVEKGETVILARPPETVNTLL